MLIGIRQGRERAVVFRGVQGQGVEMSGRTKYFLPVHDHVRGMVFAGFVVHPRDKTVTLRYGGFSLPLTISWNIDVDLNIARWSIIALANVALANVPTIQDHNYTTYKDIGQIQDVQYHENI